MNKWPKLTIKKEKSDMKQVINLEDIKEVYNGRPGCSCGCRGNYSTSKRSMQLILKKYNEAKNVEFYENFVFWDSEDGERTYTIYLKEWK